MDQEERKEFVAKHRTAVFGFGRKSHGPAMSIVYYVMDDGDILVSTMAERGKAKAVARNPKVSLAILDEQRVVLRVTPYGSFETPPRHVDSVDDLEGLTHWTSSILPWTSPDG